MATSTQKILRLTFATSLGKTYTITLQNPREDLAATEVEAIMDLIIAKNMFITSGGELTGKRDIKIIDTTTADLYDPPLS